VNKEENYNGHRSDLIAIFGIGKGKLETQIIMIDAIDFFLFGVSKFIDSPSFVEVEMRKRIHRNTPVVKCVEKFLLDI